MPETTARNQYNRLAAIYDWWWSSYIRRSLGFLKQWAQIPPNARVLDIACGTGEFERLILAEHGTQCMVGVDVAKQMLAVATEKVGVAPHVSFHVASAKQLPFADRSFDVVVTASAFHYFDDPSTALAEMRRVLVPDGKLVLLDWCRDFATVRLIDWVLQVIDPAHKRAYTQAELHHFLNEAGFEVRAATRQRFGMVWGLMAATATKDE
jgi:ubiquinone/menaquinone biosynthesis C-methylase UbiE